MTARTTRAESTTRREIMAAIAEQSAETLALLHMVKVFCNLEDRDMDSDDESPTLADAAPGLSVLMGDLADRVDAMQTKVTELDALYEKGGA